MTTYWTAENRPENHPQWAEQVLLERAMLTTGADHYRQTVNEARVRKDVSDLSPYRRLIKEFVLPFETVIQAWRDKYPDATQQPAKAWEALGISKATFYRRGLSVPDNRRGTPAAIDPLRSVPSDVLALVTLRSVLDRTTTGTVKVTALALAIGTAAEHEARINAWQSHDQELWNEIKASLQKEADEGGRKVRQADVKRAMAESGHLTFAQLQQKITDQKATVVHRRRVNVNRFNKVVKASIGWGDWSDDLRRHVGLAMIDLLITATGRFKIIADPLWERPRFSPGKKAKWERPPMVLAMDTELQNLLSKALEKEEIFHPFFMPTIIPPRDWAGIRDGGYHTDLLPQRTMIRFKAHNEEQRRIAEQDMSSVDMPEVYAALNSIQRVPWAINEAVYAVALHAWEKDWAIGGMPRQDKYPRPERQLDFPEDFVGPLTPKQERSLKRYKQELTKWHGKNAKLASNVFKTKRIIGTASQYIGKSLYFPHHLDFRGRMYPIPVDLNPQGEDLARGLLTFAEGKPLTDEGVDWLAVQVANTYGNDKVAFEERVRWVLDREETWRRIAADPLANREWDAPGVAEPWQHLAAIFEWVRYLEEGLDFVTTLPVRVDGTCNGIQHLSAMIRDEVGGASVNLVPSEEPHDIYKEVAVLVQTELERLAAQDEDALPPEGLAKHDNAVFWLHALDGEVPRSLTKRPVMILPYGGTREAYQKYIMKWLEDNETGTRFPEDRRYKLARFMTNIMWAIIRVKLEKAVKVQEWLQSVAKTTADCSEGAPLRWRVPSGFLVRHFYGERQKRQIETRIDGKRVDLVKYEYAATLSIQDHLQGIAPNFTHAMDAAALMESIGWAKAAGVTSITTIHDAYGTVASDVGFLNDCLRAAFVNIYDRHDPLAEFFDACKDIADTGCRASGQDPEAVQWPPRPEQGQLDITGVAQSDYFFA